MRVWRTSSHEETHELGRRLASSLSPNGTLLLEGELGCGKTVLTQGVGEGLGIDPEEIQSPTFTLVHHHSGERGQLVHIDLYRLAPEEAVELGLEEILAACGVKVVEWAERLPFEVAEGLVLSLRRLADGGREIRCENDVDLAF